MTEYIIFGIIDNAVMLSGALFGVSIEKKFTKRLRTGFLGATVGAGLGNAFSDFLGGLGATNIGIGCRIRLRVSYSFNFDPLILDNKREV